LKVLDAPESSVNFSGVGENGKCLLLLTFLILMSEVESEKVNGSVPLFLTVNIITFPLVYVFWDVNMDISCAFFSFFVSAADEIDL
jgi:hypothetical protein